MIPGCCAARRRTYCVKTTKNVHQPISGQLFHVGEERHCAYEREGTTTDRREIFAKCERHTRDGDEDDDLRVGRAKTVCGRLCRAFSVRSASAAVARARGFSRRAFHLRIALRIARAPSRASAFSPPVYYICVRVFFSFIVLICTLRCGKYRRRRAPESCTLCFFRGRGLTFFSKTCKQMHFCVRIVEKNKGMPECLFIH